MWIIWSSKVRLSNHFLKPISRRHLPRHRDTSPAVKETESTRKTPNAIGQTRCKRLFLRYLLFQNASRDVPSISGTVSRDRPWTLFSFLRSALSVGGRFSGMFVPGDALDRVGQTRKHIGRTPSWLDHTCVHDLKAIIISLYDWIQSITRYVNNKIHPRTNAFRRSNTCVSLHLNTTLNYQNYRVNYAWPTLRLSSNNILQ